tara:strand:- start:54 stop:1148 length:1095 start_codon:yes stop_codon:yes gene_type:complete
MKWDNFFNNKFISLINNKVSAIALLVIFCFFLLSVFAYQLMPDNTPNANSIQLSIAKQIPGFKANFLLVKKDSSKINNKIVNTFFWGEDKSYNEILIKSYKISNDTIYYNLYDDNIGLYTNQELISNLSFSKNGDYIEEKTFLLGTDKYGRDLLSRVILGTRISFSVGFISVFISVFIGVFLGMLSGYYRGKVDLLICWLINVIWSIPTLLLVIAISLILGKGFWQVFVAVGLTMWVEVARVTRGEVLRIVQLPYIEAVKSFGLNDFSIMVKHILPNIINPIIIISAANFATSVLLESGLSFLGIGVQPPMSSWGMIIKNHYGFIVMEKAYLSFIPGFCIVLLVLSFMILGNSLRDLLDTKLKK